MPKWILHNLAAFFSSTRLVLSFVACVLVILATWWHTHLFMGLAAFLLLVAVFTEPIDGRLARRWEPRGYWYASNGVEMNAWANIPLCAVLPAAIFVNIAAHWVMAGHTLHGVVPTLVWGLFCLWFAGGTKFFEKAKAQLLPKYAEQAEVMQGWFAGIIVIFSGQAIICLGGFSERDYWALVLVSIIVVSVFSGSRTWAREDERDKGFYNSPTNTKTWKQFLTRS